MEKQKGKIVLQKKYILIWLNLCLRIRKIGLKKQHNNNLNKNLIYMKMNLI
jgi:hypothetical protein